MSAAHLLQLQGNVRFHLSFERLLIAIGCACLAVVALSFARAAVFQETTARTFDRDPVAATQLEPARGDVIGRLEIPRLRFSVMVIEGDDDATLARAAGHLPGTAFPWDQGNTAIAGHRDTFFRPLRNIQNGDEIRMTTARGTFAYHVVSTEVVQPENVSVLAPTEAPSLTLVTCYPFVYVGRAPKRFIIHAQ